MDVMKFTVFAFMLTECYLSTKGMSLCNFDEISPFEEKEGTKCFNATGCTRPNPAKTRQLLIAEVTTKHPPTNQSTTSHLSTDQVTTGYQTTDQVSTSPATTIQKISKYSSTNELSKILSSTEQLTNDHHTTDRISTNHSTTKGVRTTKQSTTSHSPTGQVTIGYQTTGRVSASPATTGKGTTKYSSTNESSISHSSSDELIIGHHATDQLSTNHATMQRVTSKHSVTKQSTASPSSTGQVTSGHQTTNRLYTRHATTVQVTTNYEPNYQSTNRHPSADQVTIGHATTDPETTQPIMCPPNMVYINCATCQGTCMDPTGCISDCTEPETCVCINGYLLKDDNCVPKEECGCFVQGEGVVPEGAVYILPDCSSRCSCNSGLLSCDDSYQCSPYAVCEERENVVQCYCNEGYAGDGVSCAFDSPLLDCKDAYDRGSTESGMYLIKPSTWAGEPFEVYCNMTDGGGWTVFQRRVDGLQDFFLYWSDYKDGFGEPALEHWLGNDKLHSLTTQGDYQLRIDLVNRYGDPYYAKYSYFRIGDEGDEYRLILGSYTGNAGDALSLHNGRAFTTRDRDNDRYGVNCATHGFKLCGPYTYYNGAWWYDSCLESSLNSPYGADSFCWFYLPGNKCNLKYAEMKIRRI